MKLWTPSNFKSRIIAVSWTFSCTSISSSLIFKPRFLLLKRITKLFWVFLCTNYTTKSELHYTSPTQVLPKWTVTPSYRLPVTANGSSSAYIILFPKVFFRSVRRLVHKILLGKEQNQTILWLTCFIHLATQRISTKADIGQIHYLLPQLLT